MPVEDCSSDSLENDEFVPAVFANDDEEAEKYRKLLEDHEIEAVVGYDALKNHLEGDVAPGGMAHGLPVLVLESLLDEASRIIADREDLNEFEIDDEESDDDDDGGDGLDLELDDEGQFEVEAGASASDLGELPEDDLFDDDALYGDDDDEEDLS